MMTMWTFSTNISILTKKKTNCFLWNMVTNRVRHDPIKNNAYDHSLFDVVKKVLNPECWGGQQKNCNREKEGGKRRKRAQ
mmetsp:Transcript_26463/g.52732  ORF Transcript_26463/g.52732 Transcript_26463/m.52732 type:complete len:80 (+) Transcript_26463:99-338(+)